MQNHAVSRLYAAIGSILMTMKVEEVYGLLLDVPAAVFILRRLAIVILQEGRPHRERLNAIAG
jgi:hypothetical protein